MRKPTYYLVRNEFATQKDYEVAKELYSKLGFRVVTYVGAQDKKEIQEGLKAIIKNHMGYKGDEV